MPAMSRTMICRLGEVAACSYNYGAVDVSILEGEGTCILQTRTDTRR